ncbi:ribosome-binding factor A [Blattabacterium cuenoti]|uniref:ribosome-binding factor A n=1 Tax=Blattabacterium cuenoti TaxID=1653831 RepID=UPI00163BACF8|nr:ribosome-binding factor A [Blattabacterium cuenoti]
MNPLQKKKLNSIFYSEIANMLQEEVNKEILKKGILITLIKISFSQNMNLIKGYISIYPFIDEQIINQINYKTKIFRKYLSKKLRYHVKKIPRLNFIILNNSF